MPIPHYDVFKLNTNNHAFFEQARGPNIKKIDAALEAWWKKPANSTNAAQIALLAAIVSNCSQWMKLKRLSENKLAVSRRVHIASLANDVLVELENLETDATGRMKISFNQKKIKALSANAPQRSPATTMAGVYAHERALYLRNKKQTAPSASLLHRYLGNSLELGAPEVKKFKGKKFEQLTEEDFRKLSELSKESAVEYMKKSARLDYWVEVNGNGLLQYKKDGTLLDTTRSFIWAMDEYGNLYCAEGQYTDKQRNHSSFNAGKDIICAGALEAQKGVLLRIDNASGHYKPDKQALHRAVKALEDEGLDFGNATVSAVKIEGTRMTTNKYRATDFLANPDSLPFETF
ncbi:hypothetical protein DBV14_04010 [Variovorax sp. KBW07]|nr:hypothetical protein DBV14_04010 [Variovorax sp. KBW07]